MDEAAIMSGRVRQHGLQAAHERAIIDIGSNTVRLVIFTGPLRAPRMVLNEKVTARLGKAVYETGELSDKAMQTALAALERYARLLQAREVRSVDVVATAAPRDAGNGAEFLAAVARIGFAPQLLSGEEEALTSAQGVIGAFPGARGVVADLGGGSLELVHVKDGAGDHGCSLPFGSLRLPGLLAAGAQVFNRTVRKAIKASGFECGPDETLYLVGGSHRALARFAMLRRNWPLDDPHGFTLNRDQAVSLCRALRSGKAPAIVPGLSASRCVSLPHTAALLSELLREVKPAAVVFSSWGLREGRLHAGLKEGLRKQDPLLAGIADFAARQGIAPALARGVTRWIGAAAQGRAAPGAGLCEAAVTLALATQRSEPNLRAEQAVNWALRKRWIGVSAEGRAMMAACALANCGASTDRADLARLASSEAIARASTWGSAVRLCRRLTGEAPQLFAKTRLAVQAGELHLTVDPDIARVVNDAVLKDLRALAARLMLKPMLQGAPLEEFGRAGSKAI
jgi:exopolyphosphatase/guanosine-5'-triphosphate,3'-diphosphate pyrophosphatase